MDAEIIVIDNNSTDDSCAMVQSLFPEVTLISNEENIGFSAANNIGVSRARGDYVCILNPDTVVAENTFMSLLVFAEQQSNLGIVGCRLIDGTGKFLPESKRNLPLVSVALKKMLGNSESYYANHVGEHSVGAVDILVGAFMFMKRDLYNDMDGFDEDYFMYGEDIDLSYRVLKAGYSNYYFGDTTVIHFKGESTLKDVNYARKFYNAMSIFYRKHFRKYLLYDAMVWLGIKLAFLVRRHAPVDPPLVDRYVVISDDISDKLLDALPKTVELKGPDDRIGDHTEIILDANMLSYKTIIEFLAKNDPNTGNTFKILPKNSSFILGSYHSKSRGEVIVF
jgi:GT2 family glycosyltransferase